MSTRHTLLLVLVGACYLAWPEPANAIPAYARKYGTSCLTCHTVFPKLSPFGEAFRRNGYRFPGVDSDYVKQAQVALGQEANKKTFPNSVWPASIPESLPIAIGANGTSTFYPDKTSSVPRQNNGTQFSISDIVAEGHLWAGAALDDKITLWGELTFSSGGVDIEHAQILFNDLPGPKHLLNLVIGKGFPTISSFAPHSSYIADLAVTNVPVTGIYGASGDPFVLADNYPGAELNGVIAGRADYSIGVHAGRSTLSSAFNSTDFHAHLGFKLGGMRLDGEGAGGNIDALHPWAETSLTPYGFFYRSIEHFGLAGTDGNGQPTTTPVDDRSITLGGGLRAQLSSLELNMGFYDQKHNGGTDVAGEVRADVLYGELSYVLFPWLVPAVRVESVSLRPTGGSSVNDVHLMPGVAFLVRANVKLVAVANIELANGFPTTAGGEPLAWQGGAADWGSLVLAPRSAVNRASQEFSSFAVNMMWAM